MRGQVRNSLIQNAPYTVRVTTNEDTIKRYFAAWEAQEVESLPEIFTEDALYVVHPFGVEEHKGLPAITEYWNAQFIANQVHPKPVALTKLVGYNRVFVEWQCDFATPAGENKRMRGIMVLEFKNGLIAELREHSDIQEI